MDNIKTGSLKRKLSSFLSLSQRAGKLITGESACEIALRNGEAKIVVVCADASDNTKKKFSQKTFYYEKPYYEFGSKSELAGSVGKENRAVYAVTDEGFCAKIKELIEELLKEDVGANKTQEG